MNKKVLILSSILLLPIVLFITAVLFFKISSVNYVKAPSVVISEEKAINVKFDNAELAEKKAETMFCKKDSECLKKIFLNCNRGNGYITDDGKRYAFIINNKTQEKCNFSFIGVDTDNSSYSSYCVVDLKNINENYFNNILLMKNRDADINCATSK